tara:strand:- start:6841 stop:7755 length:915 start_codon:yes stop_codon:yes gene_type:complete
MFNLFISSNPDSWDFDSYQLDKVRVFEYTADEISERYKDFDASIIEELKGLPSLFVIEREERESRVGYISNIEIRERSVVIYFEFDTILPSIPIGAIEALKKEIDLGDWELSRTHWSIKDAKLFDLLLTKGYITQDELQESVLLRAPEEASEPVTLDSANGELNHNEVFIVHGRDEIAKYEMSQFIEDLGLKPIILHEQASLSRTIIEKIEAYSNVGFGVVLYTPCDVGRIASSLTSQYRARQNVVFEHGYLIGKLGRSRVSAIIKGDVETPNDISGVIYEEMDKDGLWKEALKIEMRAAGYNV